MAQNDGMRGPSPHPDYDDGGWHYPEPAVSETLWYVREQQELDLRDISKELRIRHDYLLAIEEGRYHDLPGATYAIGFVRSYADYLGLDSDAMVQRFKSEVRDLASAPQDLSFPAPKPEGRIPGVALVLISVLLIAVVYGAWYFWNDQGRPYVELLPGASEQEGASSETETATNTQEDEGVMSLDNAGGPDGEETATSPDTVSPESGDTLTDSPVTEEVPSESAGMEAAGTEEAAEAPDAESEPALPESEEQAPQADDRTLQADDETAAPMQEESGQAVAPDTESGTESGSEAGGEEVDEQAGEDSAIPGLPGNGEDAADETQAEMTSGRVYGEENEEARIVLEATADSWVQIRDAEGELVFTRVLRAGESYRVPDAEGMTLLTGNAGGLDIRVDGSVTPSLGGMGTVRRDIPLDPQQLFSGTFQ